MKKIFVAIKRALIFSRKNNLVRLIMLTLVILILGSLGIGYFEKDTESYAGKDPNKPTWWNAIWWSFVTMTTVGYGDLFPQTIGGRIIGIFVMLFGVGFLGMLTATIASIFVEKKMREGKGLEKVNLTKHVVVCGWNPRAENIIEELLASRLAAFKDIVLVANIEENPIEDESVYFVKGDPTDEDVLIKAGIKKAEAAIVLAGGVGKESSDADAVLTTLAIETLNPDVYTCVELNDPKNIRHCERAHADEIIVTGDMSTKLLVGAAQNPGISYLFSELITSKYGNQIVKKKLPDEYINQTFDEVFLKLRQEKKAILIALQTSEGDFIANPQEEYRFKKGDEIYVMAFEKLVLD